jgi:Flp pilus assembly protein TadG
VNITRLKIRIHPDASRGHEDGNALVEASLILPVMVLMLLACLDFGVILQKDAIVVDSARAAAQYATLQGISTNLTAIQNVASTSAASISGYHAVAADVCTCGPGGAVVACTSTTSCSGYGTPSEYVTVTASASIPLLFAIRGFPITLPVQSIAGTRVVWTNH